MTEPPRPPGEGNANDPTAPFNPYAANDPTSGSTPPPPPPGGYSPPPAGGYAPPPSSGGGYPPPPASGGGYAPPPSSGGGFGTPPPPTGGYGPPPGGYNQPPQGYGYGAPAGGQDDKTWIAVAHFGGAAGAFISGGVAGWIAPLIAYLARGPQSPAVRAEAVKALNFQILWSIIGLVGWITACIVIGWLAVAAAWIVGTVFGVIAGVKANNNEPYNYPMTVSIIK